MSTWRLCFRSFPITLVAILVVICSCAGAWAADVPLVWDPSVSTNIAGYKVYVGTTSGTYGAPILIGNQTTYLVPKLSGGTYYFAVTAIDVDGNESDFSNEISRTIVTSSVTCNINGDSSINDLDLQALANVILGINVSSASYDLNQDSRVDVLDLQILNNVVLGVRSCP